MDFLKCVIIVTINIGKYIITCNIINVYKNHSTKIDIRDENAKKWGSKLYYNNLLPHRYIITV